LVFRFSKSEKEINNVKQQPEAIDAGRRIGGHFDVVFTHDSGGRQTSTSDDKYQPRRRVEFTVFRHQIAR
jgi:hypothetical protein